MTSETSSAKVTDEPKKVDFCDAWFQQDIKQLPDATRELFETYSGVEADEVIDHIQGLVSFHFPGPRRLYFSAHEMYGSLMFFIEITSLRHIPLSLHWPTALLEFELKPSSPLSRSPLPASAPAQFGRAKSMTVSARTASAAVCATSIITHNCSWIWAAVWRKTCGN